MAEPGGEDISAAPLSLHLKGKVCVLGEAAVGKTSLVRRYVLGEFRPGRSETLAVESSVRGQFVDARDLIGLTFSKPRTTAWREDWPRSVRVELIIWDVVGSKTFTDVHGEAYFQGARGALAVVDVTRRETLDRIADWLGAFRRVAGPVPVVLVVNKSDLRANAAFGEPDVRALAEAHAAPYVFTSAKRDENVEATFKELATRIVVAWLDHSLDEIGAS